MPYTPPSNKLLTIFAHETLDVSLASIDNLAQPVIDKNALHENACEVHPTVQLSQPTEYEQGKNKQQRLRRRSGEIARPALCISHQRSSSAPDTPPPRKAVRFDSHLVDICPFIQRDSPISIRTGPFSVEKCGKYYKERLSDDNERDAECLSFKWVLVPAYTIAHIDSIKRSPVMLRKLQISSDQTSIVGTVAVSNLAFQKSVTCRFSFDYWQTVSEVSASYCGDTWPGEVLQGYDWFRFTINLSDIIHIASHTLRFCIRYAANGEEFWDNNAASNFRVRFRKQHLPQTSDKSSHIAALCAPNSLQLNLIQDHVRGLVAPSAPSFCASSEELDEYQIDQTEAHNTHKSRSVRPNNATFPGCYDLDVALSSNLMLTAYSTPRTYGEVEPTVGCRLSSVSYKELLEKYCFSSSRQAVEFKG